MVGLKKRGVITAVAGILAAVTITRRRGGPPSVNNRMQCCP